MGGEPALAVDGLLLLSSSCAGWPILCCAASKARRINEASSSGSAIVWHVDRIVGTDVSNEGQQIAG